MKSVLVLHCALNLDLTCGQGLCLSWSSLCHLNFFSRNPH